MQQAVLIYLNREHLFFPFFHALKKMNPQSQSRRIHFFFFGWWWSWELELKLVVGLLWFPPHCATKHTTNLKVLEICCLFIGTQCGRFSQPTTVHHHLYYHYPKNVFLTAPNTGFLSYYVYNKVCDVWEMFGVLWWWTFRLRKNVSNNN